MSDIEIVSQWSYRNPDANRVPYGTVFADGEVVTDNASEHVTIESLMGEPAVDWRGVDTPAKRGPGRPKKVS